MHLQVYCHKYWIKLINTKRVLDQVQSLINVAYETSLKIQNKIVYWLNIINLQG